MLLVEILMLMQVNHGLYQTADGWVINGETVDEGRCEWLVEQGFIQTVDPNGKYGLTEKGKNIPPDQVMFA